MFRNRITWQLGLITLLLIVLGYIFSRVFTYLIISLVIATILGPLVNTLTRMSYVGIKIPRAAAVLLSFGILILVLSSIIIVFVPLVSDQLRLLSTLNYEEILFNLQEPIGSVEDFLLRNNLTDSPPGFIMDSLKDNIFKRIYGFEFTELLTQITQLTVDVVIGLLAILFISFFFLYEKGLVKRSIIRLIPNAYFELSITALYQIEQLLSNYLIGLLIEIFAIFGLISLGLTLIGIEYAVTIALFAAVAHVIPYFGAAIGIIFGIVVGLSTTFPELEFQGYAILALKIFLVHWGSLMIDNILIQPLVFGRSVHAHPLEIFIIIFVGAAVSGASGMILAIPAYTILRVTITQLYLGYRQYNIFSGNRSVNRVPLGGGLSGEQ